MALQELCPTDSTSEVMDKFLGRVLEASNQALTTIDPKELERAVDAILAADRIVLLGNGGSLYLAASTGLKLMKLGLTAISYLDYNGIQASALLLRKGMWL